jgi:hypothetical protein
MLGGKNFKYTVSKVLKFVKHQVYDKVCNK